MEETLARPQFPDVFAGLDDGLLQTLLDSRIQKNVREGELIVNQGEHWPYFFWVLKGEISVNKESSEGRMLVASTIQLGETFWGITFFSENVASPVILQAKVDTVLDMWGRDVLLPLIENNAALAWNIV
jgi:CRP-like cAMP-binding protein